MRYTIFIFITLSIMLGCKETIIQPGGDDKIWHNDLLHGDIIGKVTQKESGAKIIISQVESVDSVSINPLDGSFVFNDLRAGNYTMKIVSDNYRTFQREVVITGGTIMYVGEIKLSTVPDMVNSHYPEDQAEIVTDWRYGRISVSIYFVEPMDRASVEKAFSTDPPSEGIFQWGTYTQAPYTTLYTDASLNAYGRAELGATITTYSKVRAMTYVISQKDTYVDTTYTITLSTEAKDTAGNHLRFPLQYRFRTVQSYTTLNGIQTLPVHGDVSVEPMSNSIQLTFPRRMNPASTEAATTVSPSINNIFLWPEENVMRIYTGGPLLSDTTFIITVAGSALDKDGVPLGTPFTFSFRTAPFRVSSTSPTNAEVFVSPSQQIFLSFNSYVIKSSVQSAFSISPAVSGTFSYYNEGTSYESRNQIIFTPSQSMAANTKYTVTISTAAKDLFNVPLKSAYTFSFVVRPN